MKNLDFLNKLINEEKIELVESSEEISKAYTIKSDKCIKVAELASDAGIYENAISEAYYSIYNSVLSLFFKCGIKCENHSGAVILIKDVFGLEELYLTFSEFKKDRIDNQYYLPITQSDPVNKENCKKKINSAKEFNMKIKAFSNNLKIKEIKEIRKRFDELKKKS